MWGPCSAEGCAGRMPQAPAQWGPFSPGFKLGDGVGISWQPQETPLHRQAGAKGAGSWVGWALVC